MTRLSGAIPEPGSQRDGRPIRIQRRGFYKVESRVFCPCELCRLRFGRLRYPKRGGSPLGLGQSPSRRAAFREALRRLKEMEDGTGDRGND